MLLIIEALLLISAALGQDYRAAAARNIFPLDMAQNSVDDNYDGCTKEMANLVKTKYLEKEMQSNFANAWKHAEKNYKPPGDNLTKNHSIAIYVYTNSKFEIYKDFNNAVHNEKKKYQNKKFTWYSLHFLLTDAVQILKKTQKGCMLTYHGTNVNFNESVLNKEVRFGSFASSSFNHTKTKFFGNKSCFVIYTCKGANLTKYSKHDKEEEVLIPPYETFQVTAVKTRKQQNDLWCDTVYTLKSSGNRSDLNCALFKKPPKTITQY
ncbi:GPI-linked NAD(P)(+)--arginine ADP-ribosyltransferase 1-like [Sinocyclocheilus grahami]|uniref:GPI-linked NAD(P)(+)--arginine ADP-ribosyltransferase 1-like n=1 Tax=Sinocyclocheilus grahami TaxID=75366 RepID=UPI0007AC69F8|nr:PREDICTED: GPI-linked NAD(P)(+)--arginine ADP-ribosyltransferase 1-like [Sinocyclocheilus grahami]